MERWIKYKDNIINIAQCQSFEITRIGQKARDESVYYTDDLKPTKEKPWTLMVNHHGLDIFKTKADAVKVAEAIVKGTYDM